MLAKLLPIALVASVFASPTPGLKHRRTNSDPGLPSLKPNQANATCVSLGDPLCAMRPTTCSHPEASLGNLYKFHVGVPFNDGKGCANVKKRLQKLVPGTAKFVCQSESNGSLTVLSFVTPPNQGRQVSTALGDMYPEVTNGFNVPSNEQCVRARNGQTVAVAMGEGPGYTPADNEAICLALPPTDSRIDHDKYVLREMYVGEPFNDGVGCDHIKKAFQTVQEISDKDFGFECKAGARNSTFIRFNAKHGWEQKGNDAFKKVYPKVDTMNSGPCEDTKKKGEGKRDLTPRHGGVQFGKIDTNLAMVTCHKANKKNDDIKWNVDIGVDYNGGKGCKDVEDKIKKLIPDSKHFDCSPSNGDHATQIKITFGPGNGMMFSTALGDMYPMVTNGFNTPSDADCLKASQDHMAVSMNQGHGYVPAANTALCLSIDIGKKDRYHNPVYRRELYIGEPFNNGAGCDNVKGAFIFDPGQDFADVEFDWTCRAGAKNTTFISFNEEAGWEDGGNLQFKHMYSNVDLPDRHLNSTVFVGGGPCEVTLDARSTAAASLDWSSKRGGRVERRGSTVRHEVVESEMLGKDLANVTCLRAKHHKHKIAWNVIIGVAFDDGHGCKDISDRMGKLISKHERFSCESSGHNGNATLIKLVTGRGEGMALSTVLGDMYPAVTNGFNTPTDDQCLGASKDHLAWSFNKDHDYLAAPNTALCLTLPHTKDAHGALIPHKLYIGEPFNNGARCSELSSYILPTASTITNEAARWRCVAGANDTTVLSFTTRAGWKPAGNGQILELFPNVKDYASGSGFPGGGPCEDTEDLEGTVGKRGGGRQRRSRDASSIAITCSVAYEGEDGLFSRPVHYEIDFDTFLNDQTCQAVKDAMPKHHLEEFICVVSPDGTMISFNSVTGHNHKVNKAIEKLFPHAESLHCKDGHTNKDNKSKKRNDNTSSKPAPTETQSCEVTLDTNMGSNWVQYAVTTGSPFNATHCPEVKAALPKRHLKNFECGSDGSVNATGTKLSFNLHDGHDKKVNKALEKMFPEVNGFNCQLGWDLQRGLMRGHGKAVR